MSKSRKPSPPTTGYKVKISKEDAEELVKYGQWRKVSSSNVAAVKYEASKDNNGKVIGTGTLHVQFKGTAKGVKHPIYKYLAVPPNVAKAMFWAASKGRYVHRALKGNYTFEGPL